MSLKDVDRAYYKVEGHVDRAERLCTEYYALEAKQTGYHCTLMLDRAKKRLAIA